nr:replication protein B [Mute swan feces associated circular virus 5]
MSSIPTTPWTPGYTDSEASTQSPAERYLLPPRLPTSRVMYAGRTPDPSPQSVRSSPVVMSSQPREPPSSAEPIASRTRSTASVVPRPWTQETLRSFDGQTPFQLLRQAGSMRYQPIYTSATSETSTESDVTHSPPSSPSPIRVASGYMDPLVVENPEESEDYIQNFIPSP